MHNSPHRSGRSVIGPPRPKPWTMRQLLQMGEGRGGSTRECVETRQVFAALKDLPIPRPWNLRAFIDALQEQRCRPIRLEPYPAEAQLQHPCGMWIRCEDADIIFYERSTSQYHCQHIILHEIGHMVLGHEPLSVDAPGPGAMQQLMPDVDAAAMVKVLGRTTFDNEVENEAELFASLLLSLQCTTIRDFDSVLGRGRRRGQSTFTGPVPAA